MIHIKDNINDFEIRVIGVKYSKHPHELIASTQPIKPKRKKGLIWTIIIIIILTGIIVAIILWQQNQRNAINSESQRSELIIGNAGEPTIITPLGDYSDTTNAAYTEHLVDTINDIPLDIYIPHNAKAELIIGVPDIKDKSIILATQAADTRADNGKIVGAFVVNGKPMSWGLSKQGYCGIIGDTITVGVAANSPLFEKATEVEGHFFRQYPLVKNGSIFIDNAPKGKAIRKALCDRNGEIMVIMSKSEESFHDFAQALADMHVDNAIYLVGSNSYGYFRDKFDHFTQIYEKRKGGKKYENFIVWRK